MNYTITQINTDKEEMTLITDKEEIRLLVNKPQYLTFLRKI